MVSLGKVILATDPNEYEGVDDFKAGFDWSWDKYGPNFEYDVETICTDGDRWVLYRPDERSHWAVLPEHLVVMSGCKGG